jgi:AGZA family xanthine/uracil permease-like MFS transporter
MTGQVKYINWAYVGDSVPAFVTLAVMPLTYSVAYGLIAYAKHYELHFTDNADNCRGLITYTALNLLIYATMKISTFFTKDGRPVEPLNYDSAEYWTCKSRSKHVAFTSSGKMTLVDNMD